MYDPLLDSSPAHQNSDSHYWQQGVTLPRLQRSLRGCHHTDVAIIGGGYTGLLSAFYLASEFDIDCCVLEANRVGFGASGRNAGFVLPGAGRLSYQQIAARWDLATARGIYAEYHKAVERVAALIDNHKLDCDTQTQGYLRIAHNQRAASGLRKTAGFISTNLDSRVEYIGRQRLRAEFVDHQASFGAIRFASGFGIQPLKLLLGYRNMLLDQAIPLFENTCVKHWQDGGARHRLQTDAGEILAKRVIIAGNAYNSRHLHPAIDGRFIPVLSHIIVTAPLSVAQLRDCGLATRQLLMDTRRLKYYYRLLPDNRLLFGGRGAISGRHADAPIYAERLRQALVHGFPSLAGVNLDYHWSGWIAAALDDMPHVYGRKGVAYSLGYCGMGVAYSAQAAYRLAQRMAGRRLPPLPLYHQALPTVPLARFRRLGQFGYYQYARFRDSFG